MVPDDYNEPGGCWKYWYLASPHMKDICKSLNDLEEKYGTDYKYGTDFQIISVTMNHQNYIVLYRYWEEKDDSDVDGNTNVHSGDSDVDLQGTNRD